MHKVTNLTNGPQELQTKAGKVIIAAKGEVTGEFSDDYLDLLRAGRAVRVEPVSKPKTRKRA